jgi:hypothetical protein
MTISNYIDRGGELVYQPPFLAEHVGYYGFILDADKAKLQEVCDRYLNSPLGARQRFVPAGGFVLLACCDLPSLQSTTEPYRSRGSMAEREVAIWVLLIDTVKERLYWFLPYIFVDNTYAMAMGRELYGFPKSMGTISFLPDPTQPDQIALDTLVLKNYSPQSHGQVLRLVEVVKSADTFTGPSGARHDFAEFTREIVKILDEDFHLLTDASLLIPLMADLLQLKMPMVFLKQFRDVVDPVRAAYQSIVETTPFSSHIYELRFLSSHYDVMIEECDSHPISAELGLTLAGPLRPKLSFYLNFDFQIGTGVVLTPASS